MPKQKNTSATAAAHQCGNREFACGFLANAAAAGVAGLLLLAGPSLVRAGRVSQAENSMYGQRAWTNNTAIRPFRIDILEAAADQSQGVQMAKMHELIRYWGTEYDWWKVEAKLNALPQFVTEIDGLDIHFIHVRSPHGNALRLLLTHGWLGSILEFVEVIGPLTDPTAFGGRAEDALDVVIPSIPGYGFSAKPKETGWGPDRIGPPGTCS